MQAWSTYLDLNESAKLQISNELITGIQKELNEAVTYVIDTDISTLPRRISSVEVLLKTEQDEIVLKAFSSVAEALVDLTKYITDLSDIGDLPQSSRRV